MLGGSAAWENVDATEATCPKCSNKKVKSPKISCLCILHPNLSWNPCRRHSVINYSFFLFLGVFHANPNPICRRAHDDLLQMLQYGLRFPLERLIKLISNKKISTNSMLIKESAKIHSLLEKRGIESAVEVSVTKNDVQILHALKIYKSTRN